MGRTGYRKSSYIMTDLKLNPEKIAKLKKFDVLEHLQTPEGPEGIEEYPG